MRASPMLELRMQFKPIKRNGMWKIVDADDPDLVEKPPPESIVRSIFQYSGYECYVVFLAQVRAIFLCCGFSMFVSIVLSLFLPLWKSPLFFAHK